MNLLDKSIVEEGSRNAIVRLTGILDSADALENPCIQLQDFTSNDTRAYLVGLRVDRLEWSISQGMELQLFWNGLQPQMITPLAGRGKMEMKGNGGFLPRKDNPGYDGSIILQTNGYIAGTTQNFTLLIEMVKLYHVSTPLPGGQT